MSAAPRTWTQPSRRLRVKLHVGPGLIKRGGDNSDKEVKMIFDLDVSMSGNVPVNMAAASMQTVHTRPVPSSATPSPTPSTTPWSPSGLCRGRSPIDPRAARRAAYTGAVWITERCVGVDLRSTRRRLGEPPLQTRFRFCGNAAHQRLPLRGAVMAQGAMTERCDGTCAMNQLGLFASSSHLSVALRAPPPRKGRPFGFAKNGDLAPFFFCLRRGRQRRQNVV